MNVATHLFFSTNPEKLTLYKRIIPNSEQMSFIIKKWNKLAEYLIDYLSDISEVPIKSWLQGSYKFGTLIRPINKDHEFDIDLGIFFSWREHTDKVSARTVKQWVQEALLEYISHDEDIIKVTKPSKEKCARIHYRNQFHIDVPAYLLYQEKNIRLLATESNGWEHSDPKAIYLWFKENVSTPERQQLKRIICYLKIWSALKFKETPSLKPTSIMLTVLATNIYLKICDLDMPDDEAFTQVCIGISNFFSQKKEVLNPVNISENLNRFNEKDFEELKKAFNELSLFASQAVKCEDIISAIVAWSKIFGHFFPTLEEDHTQQLTEKYNFIPEITIESKIADTNQHFKNFINEVPSIPKGMKLYFRIQNANLIPPNAKVKWSVHNCGNEAEIANDLGHVVNSSENLLCVEESTKYHGRHYMCCSIEHDKNIIGYRSVPVKVLAHAFPKRNPPKPAYTKLR